MAQSKGRNYKALKEAVLTMYAHDVGSSTIAKALGISVASVHNLVRAAGMPVHNERIQQAMRRHWQAVHDDGQEQDEPVDLLGDLIEYGDDAEDLKQPVVEDDDWGREMLRTLRAIADALGVAV